MPGTSHVLRCASSGRSAFGRLYVDIVIELLPSLAGAQRHSESQVSCSSSTISKDLLDVLPAVLVSRLEVVELLLQVGKFGLYVLCLLA